MKRVMTVKETIENVLRSHDPLGLIKIGAPDDEYSGEAERLSLLLSHASKHECLDYVYKVFCESFDDSAGAKENYVVLAKELEAFCSC